MNRQRKIFMSAETGLERRAEAVLKLPIDNVSTSDGGPIDKDGDDGQTTVDNFLIEVAENGFMLVITFIDGTTEKTIHDDFDLLLSYIRSVF